MGMVHCTSCANIFNALIGLREHAEVNPTTVVDIGPQVPSASVAGILVEEIWPDHAQSFQPKPISPRLDSEPATTFPLPRPATPKERAPSPPQFGNLELHGDRTIADGGLALAWVPADVLLAGRNLTRQGKRTALALSAIGFGVIALLLAGGFMEWILWAMRETSIQAQFGHVQITRPGFLTEGSADPFAYVLPDASPLQTLVAKMPHVERLTPRVSFSGLASRGDLTLPFLAEGVDPTNDSAPNMGLAITQGKPLSPADPNGIAVGAGLAAVLQVQPGDRLTLLTNAAGGSLSGKDVHVRGIFYTSNKMINDTLMRVPITLAQGLLKIKGAHIWVAYLDKTEATEEIMTSLAHLLEKQELKLELTPWTRLADFYNKTVQLFSQQMNVVRLIIGVIIVLSISNVLVMGVMQRTAEIGTLMAVGLRRSKILLLFITEGALLGLIGGLGGGLIGYGLARLISFIGIPMPPAPGMDTGFTAEIIVTGALFVKTVLLAVLTTLLASVYPAWKASRMEIVNALRHSK